MIFGIFFRFQYSCVLLSPCTDVAHLFGTLPGNRYYPKRTMWQYIQAGPLIRRSRNSAWMFMKCEATRLWEPGYFSNACRNALYNNKDFVVSFSCSITKITSLRSTLRILWRGTWAKNTKKMSGTIGRLALNPIGLKPLGHLMTFTRHSIPCRFGFPCTL